MDIEKEIEDIKSRNKRVETDKAWETSLAREFCIMALTYLVVIACSYLVKEIDSIFLSSLVPVLGFFLSTLSLRLARKIWGKARK